MQERTLHQPCHICGTVTVTEVECVQGRTLHQPCHICDSVTVTEVECVQGGTLPRPGLAGAHRGFIALLPGMGRRHRAMPLELQTKCSGVLEIPRARCLRFLGPPPRPLGSWPWASASKAAWGISPQGRHPQQNGCYWAVIGPLRLSIQMHFLIARNQQANKAKRNLPFKQDLYRSWLLNTFLQVLHTTGNVNRLLPLYSEEEGVSPSEGRVSEASARRQEIIIIREGRRDDMVVTSN